MRVAGIVNDSIVDGDGLRMTIFFQGCPHRCEGCQNPETWDRYGGEEKSLDEIKQKILSNPLLSGITLSGGEPMMQPLAVMELARFAHEHGLNVWMYTGYTWERLLRFCEYDLLKDIDVLVDGQFVLEKRSLDLKFRGSSNQRIIFVQESLKNGAIVEYNY